MTESSTEQSPSSSADFTAFGKSLKLHDILRYMLGGAFSLFSYLWFSHQSIDFLIEFVQKHLAGTLVISAIAGISIYTLHRAILYEVFGRLALRCATRRPRNTKGAKRASKIGFCPCSIPKLELKLMDARVKRAKNQEPLSQWGAQIHFLYCSAWAIFAGNLLAWLTNGRPEWELDWLPVSVFLLFLLSAIVSNCRLRQSELHLLVKSKTHSPKWV